MSFKLSLLFLVGFIALAAAIPVEKPEEDSKDPEPVVADPEKEVPEEEESAPEGQEDESDNKDEQDSEDTANEDETKDEEDEPESETESDNKEEEPENEVEEKEQDPAEDPGVSKRIRRPIRCGKYSRKWGKKYVCVYYGKLRCSGSSRSKRGRCCRRQRRRCSWRKYKVKRCCYRKRYCPRLCYTRYYYRGYTVKRVCRRLKYRYGGRNRYHRVCYNAKRCRRSSKRLCVRKFCKLIRKCHLKVLYG